MDKPMPDGGYHVSTCQCKECLEYCKEMEKQGWGPKGPISQQPTDDDLKSNQLQYTFPTPVEPPKRSWLVRKLCALWDYLSLDLGNVDR